MVTVILEGAWRRMAAVVQVSDMNWRLKRTMMRNHPIFASDLSSLEWTAIVLALYLTETGGP